jgi:hypothetical protein
LRWKTLPAKRAGDPGRVDLVQLFEEATGVTKDDFTAVGVALWVGAEQRGLYPVPPAFIESLTIGSDRIEAALRMLASPPEGLADGISRLQERFTRWSFDVLRQYPVMRLADGGYLVLSKRLLLQRILGWLPISDLVEGLKRSARKVDAARAMNWFRSQCETDALTGLANLAGGAGPGQRLYGETDIQAAYGTAAPNADAAIEYPGCWIVAEISTRHLTRQTVVGGDPAELEDDLRMGIDDKVTQIGSTIRQLINDESRLTGHPPQSRRRFVPLLVITEGFPVNPMTMTAVAERTAAAQVFDDPRIGPLRILDQEELDIAESIAEDGGPSLLELLERHESSTLANSAFKDWVVLDWGRGTGPRYPNRLEEPHSAALEPVLHRLRREVETTANSTALGDD